MLEPAPGGVSPWTKHLVEDEVEQKNLPNFQIVVDIGKAAGHETKGRRAILNNAKQPRLTGVSLIDILIYDMPKRSLDPLPSAAFHILLALADNDLHGYAVMRQVAEQTDGRVRLGPGTLYGSIKTLLEAGLIEELDETADAELGTERRRYYRLTTLGRKQATSEADRLAGVLRIARSKRIFKGAHV